MDAAIFLDEDDVGTYTIKTSDDPRTMNKTLYLRPQENILSQKQLVDLWEKLSGRKLDKSKIHAKDFLASMEGNCILSCIFVSISSRSLLN